MRETWRGVIAPALLAGASAVVIARAVLLLPPSADGLAPIAASTAAEIGLGNIVTAVLLDFRGYDTLLEVAVLMLATVAVLAVRADSRALYAQISDRAGLMLLTLTQTLIPVALLVAVHLVWIGSTRPGGAFQGGAVLGAAGILLALSGYARPQWVGRWTMRAFLAAGLMMFLAIAAWPLVSEGMFLQYPEESRKTLILAIEALLALSIGASLAILFLSSASAPPGGEKR